MKNIVCILCLLAVSMPAFSQILKGTSTIGGSLSLSHTKNTYPNGVDYIGNALSIRPTYGYFLVNNFCIGTSLDLGLNKTTSKNSIAQSTNKGHVLGVGPFVRYYVPLDEKFYFFGHAQYLRNWSRTDYKSEFEGTPSKYISKSAYFSLGLSAGISYFLSPHTALEVAADFTHFKDKNRENDVAGTRINKIGLSAGLRIFLTRD